MPKVSVVIVSFNTRELTDKSIASVFAGSPDIEREVIVVENASVDGSLEMLTEKYPMVRVIVNEENRGYAPACNQGLREASGDYVLALNSDAFIIGDALAVMVRYMDAHPDVSALGPKLLNADGSIQYGCARRAPTFWSHMVYLSPWLSWIPALRRWCELAMPPRFYDEPNDVEVISGAAVLFRRETLRAVGYLNDRLTVNGDDVEWCARARKTGHRLLYFPAAEITHIGYASRAFDSSRMHARNVESLFILYDALYRWPEPGVLKCAMMSNIALAWLRNAILAPISARRRKRAAAQWQLFAVGWRLALNRGAATGLRE